MATRLNGLQQYSRSSPKAKMPVSCASAYALTAKTTSVMYIIDPLSDVRWTPFVEQHAHACAFHTKSWLQSLSLTYGYEPLAVTSCAPGRELQDAVPLCRIRSWATGHRLVSLPHTDHCQPLFATDTNKQAVLNFIANFSEQEKNKYLELRPAYPLSEDAIGATNRSADYVIHWLDLSPPLENIFNSFHKDSIRRKIARAEREKLQYQEGRSDTIIKTFYSLLLRTRRRHQLPPQPIEWFQNLARTMGETIQFRVAIRGDA